MKILLYLFILVNAAFAQEGFISSETCGECHQEIYQEWKSSMHANGTADKDPLFRGMYEWGIEATGGKLREKCIICHSPMSAVFKSVELEEKFNKDGINCQFCHGVKQIHGRKDAADFEIDLTTVFSFNPETDNDAHKSKHRDYYRKSDICLTCHAEMKNPADLAVCTTGDEWQQYFEKTGKTCQDCHMPLVEGRRSHKFGGSHQNSLLKDAVEMDLTYSSTDETVQISLTNKSSGHNLPTGTPLRMVILKVIALDATGSLIWQNWEQNPILEDKTALFMKILSDADNNGPVPPWEARQIKFDRKLEPGKEVRVKYKIPSAEVKKISARLIYRYAPPPIIQRFKLENTYFAEPQLITEKTLIL